MSSGLFDPSAWVAPFGLVKSERESEAKVAQGFEAEPIGLVVTYAVLILLDIASLPLAILWGLGVGRRTESSDGGG
ncbi:MAG: hypothetical protein ABEH88_05025 [Halobacteriales archaeon]